MRLVLGLFCLIQAEDEIEIEVEEIDELAISDKDLPFDPNDGFDIDNFEDEGSDPGKLDPKFKPAEDDPRNIIFNNYDDWTLQASVFFLEIFLCYHIESKACCLFLQKLTPELQANLEKMINETFKLHHISIKDLANPMTLQPKLPSYEHIYYSTRVKLMTGYDRWLGLEKLIMCKKLSDLDPKQTPIKHFYFGFWSIIYTFQKFDRCSFEIPPSIEGGMREHTTADHLRPYHDKVNLDYTRAVSMLNYLDTTPYWVVATNLMADVINAFVEYEDIEDVGIAAELKSMNGAKNYSLRNIANFIKAYFTSPVANTAELDPVHIEVSVHFRLAKFIDSVWA